jgi:hypothetical protein
MVVPSGVSWEWEDGQKGSEKWTPFDRTTARVLEGARVASWGIFQVVIAGKVYVIDVGKQEQKNLLTGFVRSLRRRKQRSSTHGSTDIHMAALLHAAAQNEEGCCMQ